MNLPQIRYFDTIPLEHKGQSYICLKDPQSIIENQIVLTPHAFQIACLLDGESNIDEIIENFSKEFGNIIIHAEDIYKVVEYLDENGALFTENFERMKSKTQNNYKSLKTREAYCSGSAYPPDSKALKIYLNRFFPKSPPKSKDRIKCLIAPHIDFDRGGDSYGKAYNEFKNSPEPRTVFIFGVAHANPDIPFILTKKAFNTPFGIIQPDVSIINELAENCCWDAFEYEAIHKTEHSIEFQVIMLAHLFGTNFKIVPILCGTFPKENPKTQKLESEHIENFLNNCQKHIEGNQDILVVAGADLAHIGKRFGDPFDIDDMIIERTNLRDMEDLEFALAVQPEKFYYSVMKDKNERRVCGINCIYSALKASGKLNKGILADYQFAHDPAGGIVTYSSISYTAKK